MRQESGHLKLTLTGLGGWVAGGIGAGLIAYRHFTNKLIHDLFHPAAAVEAQGEEFDHVEGARPQSERYADAHAAESAREITQGPRYRAAVEKIEKAADYQPFNEAMTAVEHLKDPKNVARVHFIEHAGVPMLEVVPYEAKSAKDAAGNLVKEYSPSTTTRYRIPHVTPPKGAPVYHAGEKLALAETEFEHLAQRPWFQEIEQAVSKAHAAHVESNLGRYGKALREAAPFSWAFKAMGSSNRLMVIGSAVVGAIVGEAVARGIYVDIAAKRRNHAERLDREAMGKLFAAENPDAQPGRGIS